MRRALITGFISRPDLLKLLDDCRGHLEMVFVEYAFNWGIATQKDHYRPYGEVLFWDEYPDASTLLDKVDPDAVVLLYNTSLNQIVLKLAAKQRGIRTYHLEHGLREDFGPHSYEGFTGVIDRIRAVPSGGAAGNETSKWRALRTFAARARREAPAVAGNQAFALRSALSFSGKVRYDVLGYGFHALRAGVSAKLVVQSQNLRRVDEYLAFSPQTFAFHRAHDGVIDNVNATVRYIGVPYFDRFALKKPLSIDSRNVILIDHQLHNAGFFGWSMTYRREYCAALAAVLRELGLRLFVKTHPGDLSGAWDPFVATGEVTLIDTPALEQMILSTRTILGGYSTMQLPLAGLSHTTLLTIEIHPQTGVFRSKQIVQMGAAHPIFTFAELSDALLKAETIHATQAPHKEAFISRFLYRMDGQSGKRLRDALLDTAPIGDAKRKSQPKRA